MATGIRNEMVGDYLVCCWLGSGGYWYATAWEAYENGVVLECPREVVVKGAWLTAEQLLAHAARELPQLGQRDCI